MGFLRKMSSERQDAGLFSTVRAVQRKISAEGGLAPKSKPQRKTGISEVTTPHQSMALDAPRRPTRKSSKEAQQKYCSSLAASPPTAPVRRKSKAFKENQIALQNIKPQLQIQPEPQRKISEQNKISETKYMLLATPERKKERLKSDPGPIFSPTPERKLSESVSTYLIQISEELKSILHPEGLREPELIVGLSEILDFDDVVNISNLMNCGEPSWHLAYSTSLDHHSLDTFYKKIEQYQQVNESGNLLVVVKDKSKNVFGALLTSRGKHCDYFDVYNNTTLFHCRPFRPFVCWMGDQTHVAKKYADAFYVGSKDATCGLWLNERLQTGRVQEYDMSLGLASRLCLGSENDNLDTMKTLECNFQIKRLECWSFSYNNDLAAQQA